MFNMFSKKVVPVTEQDQNEEENIVASITYLIKKNENNIAIDVSLEDFENKSIDGLCLLLDIIGSDSCYIDTINIIKGLFTNENRPDILVKIFSKIDNSIRSKIINSAKIKMKDEPCIKPSEMFR